MIAMLKCKTYRVLPVIIVILFNTACTVVGPDYVRPSIDIPTTYKEAAALLDAQTDTQTDTQTINQDWWTVYDDDFLNQLISQVELQNYSLQAVEARMRQAKSVADVARAEQSPTVALGGRNDFGLLASWEIDLWGRIQRNVEASGAAAQASVADLAATKLSLQSQLATNYFMLRIQDADIQLLQNTITSYERSLQITRNQYTVGVADRGDVAQSQAQLSTTQTQWYDAQITRAQLEHSIAVLIGKAPADFSLIVTPIEMSVPKVPSALPADLLKRRPDIAAAERQMAAASAKIGVAAAQAYPKLDLFAGVSIRKGLLGGEDLSVPLYSGGSLKANQSKAMAEYDEVVANYRQLVLNSFREVEDNLVALQLLDETSSAQTVAVKAAREAAMIMNNQYKAGVVNYQSIIIAQATALTNERGALSILSRRLLASVNLIKALGGGWNANLAVTNQSQSINENTEKSD